MPLSTNHSRQGLGHTSDLETHPFSSQNQPKSNYALPGGRAGSSNQVSRDSHSDHCSLCFTVCRARASSRVLPGARVRDSDPGALTPRTAIPLGAHSAKLPSSPSNPPKPHTYSQHLQSLYPADPSSSCKPFSHGRMFPERRKALACLQFAPPEQAGREAATLAQHSLGQSNSPKMHL